MASTWFIRAAGKVHGPFDGGRLKQLAHANKITPQSEVSQSAEGPWVLAGKVKGLFQPASPSDIAKTTPQALPPQPSPAPAPVVVGSTLTKVLGQPPVVAVQINTPPAKGSNSLGIASLILGILAFVICWIPLVGLLGLPLSVLGTALGGIGLLLAVFRQGYGIGFSIAGTVVSLLACFIAISSFLFTAKVVRGVDESFRQAAAKKDATNQVVVNEDEANAAPQPEGKGEDAADPEPDDKKDDPNQEQFEWADASKAVRQGDVQIKILGVTKGLVNIKGIGNDSYVSEEEFLQIKLELTNVSETKKLNIRGWGTKEVGGFSDSAELADNFENTYSKVGFGIGSRPEGQISVESVYPGKTSSDVLVFELPVDKAEELFLTLPAGNFGGDGKIRIRIPKEMIKATAP